MMQTLDPEQMKRDALMQQMGNVKQPVGGGVQADLMGMAGSAKPAMPEPAANGVEARNALGGYAGVGQMNGFNTGGYGGDMKAANSVKNTFGRIASRYQHAPGSLDQIFADADFQRYFPNAKRVEGGAGDKIDFGGVLSDFEGGVPVGIVDVLQGADPNNNSSQGWQWIDEYNDAGVGQAPQGGQDLASMLAMQPQGGGDDALAQIIQQIQALSNGGEDPMQREALMQLLGGQI